MSKVYEKWRGLEIDPFNINFKNIQIKEIINYFPAGNDVIECICTKEDKIQNVVIKIERSKVSDFFTESINLKKLKNEFNIKVANVIEIDKVNNKYYIVLEKLEGERLSDILNEDSSLKEKYLTKYGTELAKIHKVKIDDFNEAKQRPINNCPKLENYNEFDNFIEEYINYLKENEPTFNKDTFIHGDFHYANILWDKGEISGILDLEYSGRGFKEQDIAWSCILRPTQKFMDSIDDIKLFLIGYLKENTYNEEYLKWCLINGYCHFYLMNKSNEEYISKLKILLKKVKAIDFNNL